MNMHVKTIVAECTEGSVNNTLTFPQILGKLAEAGVESYLCDLRKATKIYYLPDGESIEVKNHAAETPVALTFDAARVEAALRQSQRNEHSYRDFCRKIAEAGCAGYLVTLLGRRAVYYGRDGGVYVEHFPGGK
ncbi:MAG TPA: DUF1398 family protein [Rhizomicrobium sp.]|nr:DUF1398 family protein [Rhizomicrobium sp.]